MIVWLQGFRWVAGFMGEGGKQMIRQQQFEHIRGTASVCDLLHFCIIIYVSDYCCTSETCFLFSCKHLAAFTLNMCCHRYISTQYWFREADSSVSISVFMFG